MSFLSEKLEALKEAAHRALDFADPEAALRRAEEDFKHAVVDEFNALKAKLEALEARFITPAAPEAPTPVPEPQTAAEVVEQPATDTVDHHPV